MKPSKIIDRMGTIGHNVLHTYKYCSSFFHIICNLNKNCMEYYGLKSNKMDNCSGSTNPKFSKR